MFTNANGTGTSFITSNTSNTPATGTVTLQIIGECIRTLTKNVTLGAPTPPVIDGTVDCKYSGRFTITNYDASFTYFVTNPMLGYRGTITSNFILVKARNYSAGDHGTVTVRASNGCGVAIGSVYVAFDACRVALPPPTAYPNPADASLTVERPLDDDPANDHDPLSVRLLDAMSQVRGSATLTDAPQTLDTSALPAGIYYLHIADGTQVVTREQIQIE